MASVQEFATQVGLGNPPISVRSLLAQFGTNSLREVMIVRPKVEEMIRTVWNADGGPSNSVGLPKSGQIMVKRSEDDWFSDFRSGTITVKHHETVTKSSSELIVRFVGLECVVRQESTDELYGVVSLIGPANRVLATQAFPGGDGILEMGPDGQRIWTTAIELYRGPVEDVVLVVVLIEHDDFTDVKEAARKIASKIAEKGGQLLGALTGIPTESVTEETWFRDGLGEVFGFVMDDIFGMGDDPYPGQSLRIPWTQIGEWGPPRFPARTRNDDPKQIPLWTHKIRVTGQDDGGDHGEYDFYFDMEVEHIDHVRTKPHA